MKVEVPLPDPRFQGCTFQTKDLMNSLDVYTLRADGSLVLTRTVLGGEMPMEAFQSHVVTKMMFYAYEPLPGIKWVEFMAVIVDGRLHRPIEKVRLELSNSSGVNEWG